MNNYSTCFYYLTMVVFVNFSKMLTKNSEIFLQRMFIYTNSQFTPFILNNPFALIRTYLECFFQVIKVINPFHQGILFYKLIDPKQSAMSDKQARCGTTIILNKSVLSVYGTSADILSKHWAFFWQPHKNNSLLPDNIPCSHCIALWKKLMLNDGLILKKCHHFNI